MTKEFIPYQQGLQLKKLGFDEPCWAWWHIEDCDIRFCYSDQRSPIINSRETEIVGLPTYQQAFRWFREKYLLFGYPFLNDYQNYGYRIVEMISDENKELVYDWGTKDTYEEAEQACLEQLIQIVNDDRRNS